MWDFAVEINAFWALGVTSSDLRRLICERVVVHGREVASTGKSRAFQRLRTLRFPSGTCFVLSKRGKNEGQERSLRTAEFCTNGPDRARFAPYWDAKERELRVECHIVKRLRKDSKAQIAVLTAFSAKHWPDRIRNPLPARRGHDRRALLRYTVQNLNRNQRSRIVHFYLDRSGVCVGRCLCVGRCFAKLRLLGREQTSRNSRGKARCGPNRVVFFCLPPRSRSPTLFVKDDNPRRIRA
jgi:hypothetical protein